MFSDDEILNEIKRVAAKLGRKSLSQSEFNRHANLCGDTAVKHFGSWNAAVESAGLAPIKPGPQVKAKRIDDDELLLDLIRLYNEFGKPPTVAIISAKGKFSPPSYKARWGNHLKAFEIAKKKFHSELAKLAGKESLTLPPRDIKPIRVVPKRSSQTTKEKNERSLGNLLTLEDSVSLR